MGQRLNSIIITNYNRNNSCNNNNEKLMSTWKQYRSYQSWNELKFSPGYDQDRADQNDHRNNCLEQLLPGPWWPRRGSHRPVSPPGRTRGLGGLTSNISNKINYLKKYRLNALIISLRIPTKNSHKYPF